MIHALRILYSLPCIICQAAFPHAVSQPSTSHLAPCAPHFPINSLQHKLYPVRRFYISSSTIQSNDVQPTPCNVSYASHPVIYSSTNAICVRPSPEIACNSGYSTTCTLFSPLQHTVLLMQSAPYTQMPHT